MKNKIYLLFFTLLILFVGACKSKHQAKGTYLPLTGGEVSGPVTLHEKTIVNSEMTLNEGLVVNQNTVLIGPLLIKDEASLEKNLAVQGDITINSKLNCTGCVSVSNISSAPINDRLLSSDASGNAKWIVPQMQFGIKFEYINASQIQLSPSGLNNQASITLSNGTQKNSVILSSPLIADLTILGAGGIDVGIEAANQGYDVYLITEEEGVSPALLLVASGSPPTMPGAYTYISEKLWFISNSVGGGSLDIAMFVDAGSGECVYVTNNMQALNDGEQTATTAVNLQPFIPSGTSKVSIYAEAWNFNIFTIVSVHLYSDAAATNRITSLYNMATSLLGASQTRSQDFSFPITSNPTNSLYYSFTANPGAGAHGLNLYVKGWVLPRRM